MFILKVLAKVTLIVLMILCFYRMPLNYYYIQRFVSFILFIFIAIVDGSSAKYFSFILSLFGVLLFNPVYHPGLTGATWDNIERWLIGIINVWVLWDVYEYMNSGRDKARIMKHLQMNVSTGMYEINDGGYKYEISPDLLEGLTLYMHRSRIGLLGDWYRKLSKEDRLKVKKSAKPL